ncbi:protein SMAX1-LIKE 4-like [Phragmites australis]|uniref:protein SMAX1-LIKE 4-like n=1 Tax=Phragmites australis TaxID=29695 RepID=UPI002D77CFBC|nr:protein SMAX1-LIKE 4-like [Phragmites australis]
MRAGAYTIHQTLTAEAAAVLKLALALARRRGHAQVTPLHVAFALLNGPAACSAPLAAFSSSSSPSPAAAYGLLKRACLRSHPSASGASSPATAAAHPLQCRALELCFNVALNRLPASGPHSPPSGASSSPFASSLVQPSPTLSNALIAALKRAQANQRRGCVELQQPPPAPTPAATAQQQTQPLLAIKVELDQLVISILDDPSVSRVMREAGFSSATVKSNLEEEGALMPPPSSSSSPPPTPPAIPPHFFLDPSIANPGGKRGGFGLWPAQFLAAPGPGMAASSCVQEDVHAVLEVMVRKQGRRSNPVVVGDSVSMAEAVSGELLRRLERGDVPEVLAGAHLLKLQLSYVHVRLMSRADVDARAAELRRSVDAVQLQRGGGLVVYVGDLRWTLDEEPPAGAGTDHHQTASSYSPVEHMVAELGRLLDDLRASRGRAWLVATASYQTYMQWQQRRRRQSPSLDAAWALQAVVVPTGGGTGLALNNLRSSSSPSAGATQMQPAMVAMQRLAQSPFGMAAEPMAFALKEEQEEKLVLCTECTNNYEREASLVKAEADAEGQRASLPGWLVPDKPLADQSLHKENYLIELKRKWSRLCRKLHICTDPCSALCPWWSGSYLSPGKQSKPSVAGFLGLEGLVEHGKGRGQWSPPSPLSRWGLSSLREPEGLSVGTTLALGSLPLSDSATSHGRAPAGGDGSAEARELERRLRRNIPWQPSDVVAEIAEAVVAGCGGNGRKGVWLYVKGSDHATTRRVATVIAETRCGSADRVVCVGPCNFSCAEEFCSDVLSRAHTIGGNKLVLVVDDIEHAPQDVVDCLVTALKSGSLKDQGGQELDLSDSILVLTTSKFTSGAGDVISLRLCSEDDASSGVLKRKTESPQRECKRPRHDAGRGLDLNLCAEEDTDEGSSDDDEAVPSDITHEGDASEQGHPDSLLQSVATHVVTLSENRQAASAIRARLAAALGREARVADDAAQALATASGHFLDEVLERWAAEVLEPAVAAATVKNGGKVVVLGVGPGGGVRGTGFMGSVLPSRVHVD